MINKNLIFIKLGGAAITDKSVPRTPLSENIAQLASQIARAIQKKPNLQVIIGHGSGSFGHFSGQKHGTRNGVSNPNEWRGFAEVWQDARQLNDLVLKSLLSNGLPVIAFPPSAWLTTNNRLLATSQINPIISALNHGLIPLVNGDVIFDSSLGGTILSTEEIFSILADILQPGHIFLASREPGVWEDYPKNTRLAARITPSNLQQTSSQVHGSAGMDVTGGMKKKVSFMLELVKRYPEMQISIISGMDRDSVYKAIVDKPSGTLLQSD
jgi:isopentenyl phosphate kinase